MSSGNDKKQPIYIHDQRWSICTAWDNPWPFLSSEFFHAGRPKRGPQLSSKEDSQSDSWKKFELNDLACGVFCGEVEGQTLGQIDLHRVVISTDAGLGKTLATKYLEYRIGAQSPSTLALRMTLSELEQITSGENGITDAIVANLSLIHI